MTGAAASRKPRRDDHRFTLKVPQVDESVVEWVSAQHDLSQSLRQLIRDEIQRNGFTDTANRPVTQLPRRGRPPAQYADESEFEQPGVPEKTTASIVSGALPEPVSVSPSPIDIGSAHHGGTSNGVAEFLSGTRD